VALSKERMVLHLFRSKAANLKRLAGSIVSNVFGPRSLIVLEVLADPFRMLALKRIPVFELLRAHAGLEL
jgi:hypothetical protein